MLDPTTLATSAAIVVGLAAAHTNPLTGAAAEAALWAWTVQQLGEQAQAALEELQAFLDKVGTAQTDQDYEEAAEHLANLLQMGAEVLLDKVLDRARGVGSPPHDAPDALTPGRPSHLPEADTTQPGGSGRPADPGEVAEGSQSLPAGTGIPVDFGAAHQPTVAARLEGDRAADGTESSQVSAGSASPAEQSADPQHQTRSESGSAPPGGSPPLPPPVGPARRQERLGQLDSQEREALEGQRNWPVDQDLSPERRRALGPEWTGEKEAKVRGFPPAEPGYHWVLDEHGTLRYDRLSTEVGPARQYHQESDRFEQRPEQPPEKRPVREFDGQANPQTVFEHLYRERQSFRQYFEALKRAGLVQDRAEVEALLGAQKGKIAYEGRTDENVRDDLKAHFREALVERMARPGSAPELRQKYADLPWETDLAEAQHQAGVRHLQERYPDLEWQRNPVKAYDQALYQERHRITSEMNPSDKGNLTERWYRAIHGDVAEHHVHFPEEATVRKAKVENGKLVLDANGEPVMEEAKVRLASNRVPDFIEGEAIHEMKAISGPLDKEGKQQFEDNMKLVDADGEVVDSSGKAHRIKEVMYTFFEPEGVKANAGWMARKLKGNNKLSFELYNAKGERKIVTNLNVDELNAEHLDSWLCL